MNREEKNQITKSKIKSSAVTEFALHGYEAASMNVICQNGGISKGIIYHYFASKKILYLDCVEECFRRLTVYLQEHMKEKRDRDILTEYFDARMDFFRENEECARLFCGAVLFPPDSLKDRIMEKRRTFDAFNQNVLNGIISDSAVRKDLRKDEILRVFDQFQNFLNAGYRNAIGNAEDLTVHENDCRNALNIFLYGIIRRD